MVEEDHQSMAPPLKRSPYAHFLGEDRSPAGGTRTSAGGPDHGGEQVQEGGAYLRALPHNPGELGAHEEKQSMDQGASQAFLP